MAFSHLEQLISEFLEWNGFLIRRNVKVGRLSHGGWETELDIIGFHPLKNRLVHYEPSMDAHPWAKRETRYARKFQAGRRFIKQEILKGLATDCALEQYAVFSTHPLNHHEIAGGKILSVDEMMKTIKLAVGDEGIARKGAIPETYPLLRTIQLTLSGYNRVL